MNAGPDVFLNDPAIVESCQPGRGDGGALMGAINVSNRYYAVHPPNDRFLHGHRCCGRCSARWISRIQLYPPYVAVLQRTSPTGSRWWPKIARHLVERMQALLGRIPGPKLLFWMSDSPAATFAPGQS